jgi:protoheme ferro-lyase
VIQWIQLLAGSLIFGAAVVTAMVLARPAYFAGIVVSLIALTAASAASMNLLSTYDTFEVALVSALALFAGAGVGYRLAVAALPLLATATRTLSLPVPSDKEATGVVLVSFTDTPRYDPRWVARRHVRLTEGAGIDVPPTAVPFVFLAQKTRYRAAGGRAQGPTSARELARRVGERMHGTAVDNRVQLVPADDPGALSAAVAALASQDTGRIAIVPLGCQDSDEIEQATAMLDALDPEAKGIRARFGTSLWHDTRLAERLAERIIDGCDDVPRSECGVVLASSGLPPEWEQRHATALAEENYFNQRVRMLLNAQGIDERSIRIAWVDWQLPDVAEALRHVAALGKTRVILAPSTIALPTLEYELDIGQAIDRARLPVSAEVVTLPCWENDEGFVDAIVRSVSATLA